MLNSLELKDKQSVLIKRCQEIVNVCKAEVREMTEDEQSEFDKNKEEIKSLREQLDELQQKLASYEDEVPTQEETNTDENKNTRSKKMEKQFSLIKAIRAVANNQKIDEVSQAVINEGMKEARNCGINVSGQIQIPVENRAAITVTSEGDDIVATDVLDVLAPLRAKNVLAQAGARFMTGLQGNVQVPVYSASNVTWETEVADAQDGAGAFTNVTLTPKRLTAQITVSKTFLVQDGCGAESVIRQDIIDAINTKLESTILGSAAGTTGKIPAGIFYSTSALDTVSDFGDVCDLEAGVEDANITGECKYIMSNKAKAALRCMIKGTNGTGMVFENAAVDGVAAYNTSNVEGKNIAYGDWSNLAIGQWGAIDLTVDPYTKAGNNEIVLTVNAYFDAAVLRDGAIKVATVA